MHKPVSKYWMCLRGFLMYFWNGPFCIHECLYFLYLKYLLIVVVLIDKKRVRIFLFRTFFTLSVNYQLDFELNWIEKKTTTKKRQKMKKDFCKCSSVLSRWAGRPDEPRLLLRQPEWEAHQQRLGQGSRGARWAECPLRVCRSQD